MGLCQDPLAVSFGAPALRRGQAVVHAILLPVANAPLENPRGPRAPSSAYSETILAGDGRASMPVDGRGSMVHPARAMTTPLATEDTLPPGKSLTDKLRALPPAIQGLWLGLVCITLLVASAATIRSLFSAPLPHRPALPVATASSTAASPSVPVVSASSTASSAPSGPASIAIGSGGPTMGGFGALSIRDRLPSHIRLRKIGPFMDDLERLLAIEPTAIDRADVRKMVADAAVYATVAGPSGAVSPEAERIFTFLTTRAGTAGPDILFDLVATRGGTRASTYAEDLLKRADVRDKGTPALRIAADLRFAATCQERTALFDRAKTDGDRRVLATLFTMARCGRGPSDCCMSTDPAYREVVRVITAKK